ncbi:TPA: hypothetical protein N0F65_002141 [Lagenidium giganteum]|uniref:Lipid droplet-associated serine hydrolase n=1 Tax=Lagenidium giganteum TaxID=4803 RepID=A0AAV2ZHQ4_9STRA|nr:TPA: hypothetical protein N0F65_002141 [Lagenidium giganteum]
MNARLSIFQRIMQQLKQRYRVVAPLLVLALARYCYHVIHKRHIEPLHGGINLKLLHRDQPFCPVEEWHDTVDGVQQHSIVLYPQATQPSNVLVLVIPGNPGIPHFYLPLMRELASAHGFRHEVRCMAHAGHFMPWMNDHRAFNLTDQADHKVAYLKQRLETNPELRLVLISHSIGSYLSLKILEAFPDRVDKVVLMQPVIQHMAKTPQGIKARPLFDYYPWVVKVVHFVEFLLPVTLRRWIVHHAVGGSRTEPVLHHAALSLVNGHVMENVLKMALHEAEEVLDLDDALIRSHEDKMLFVYSHTDHWVPQEFVKEYEEKFPAAQHEHIAKEHAFMMESDGTQVMAERILTWMKDLPGSEQPVATSCEAASCS